jgi:very-short-patch-repair endonuclease
MERLTTQEFIKRGKNVHRNKYDYSKTSYISFHEKLIIICPKHGEFTQRASDHLRYGCKECGLDRSREGTRCTANQFIQKAIIKHGNKYDYSKVVYHNNKTKVEIVCLIHGSFLQTPDNHIEHIGKGCRKCAGNILYTKKIFVSKAHQIHDYKYNYSFVEYKNIKTKVIIICSEHGKFRQTPHKHLLGNGCPTCNSSSVGERIIKKFLDENEIDYKREKTFEGCKLKRLLRFDFYIHRFNLIIEYDGPQHFKTNSLFGEENFKNTQKRDTIKNQYCEQNKIRLERIKHTSPSRIQKRLQQIFRSLRKTINTTTLIATILQTL